MTRSIERDVDIANQRATPSISGWVCWFAMMWVVLHAPVGR